MKIVIVGAGFTGLSAALSLTRRNHSVVVFEKEPALGGLAGTWKLPSWEWPIEKHYHHWFTNDTYALSLIRDLGLSNDLLFPKTVTSIYYDGAVFPFNSPLDVLTFSPLSLPGRIRTGAVTLLLKLLPPHIAVRLETTTSFEWLKRYYGTAAFRILWEPLLQGKFGTLAKTVNMAWFWARIKKRSMRLGYLKGGYHRLLEAMQKEIEINGGKFRFNTPFSPSLAKGFDATIVTTPSPIFTKLYPKLPTDYVKRLTSIPHLHALNLLLITKKPFLSGMYWLNINDRSFPFLAVVAHTNMVSPQHYGNNHLTWVANYLEPNHPYLKMTKEQLFKLYLPFLKRINPSFNLQLTTNNSQLFFGPFAQPVVGINYSRIKPDFTTPIPNVFLSNMDMVYPWDRGTNYAIELGYAVADVTEKKVQHDKLFP